MMKEYLNWRNNLEDNFKLMVGIVKSKFQEFIDDLNGLAFLKIESGVSGYWEVRFQEHRGGHTFQKLIYVKKSQSWFTTDLQSA